MEPRLLLTDVPVTYPLPLPTESLPNLPAIYPTVVTADGQRLLLDYFNANSIAEDDVIVGYDATTDRLVCNYPGWWVINYPLDRIRGFEAYTKDQVAGILFGVGKTTSSVTNWYIQTPVDADHLARPEPTAPTAPAPIVKTNLAGADVYVVSNYANGRTASQLIGDWQYQGTPAHTYGVYTTIQAAINAITVDSNQQVARKTVLLIGAGNGPYREEASMVGKNGTSTFPLVIEGVADSSGNLPVISAADKFSANAWTQVSGLAGVYRAAIFGNQAGLVSMNGDALVSGDGLAGLEQTLIERTIPGDLQEGEVTFNLASTEFLNLRGMAEESALTDLPTTTEGQNWTTVNCAEDGYLNFTDITASPVNKVFWASTWVFVTPGSTWKNGPNAEAIASGPFRANRWFDTTVSNQNNRDRVWINGQMVPSAVYSTADDWEYGQPHVANWGYDNSVNQFQSLTFREGWNHLVFQFDTATQPNPTGGLKFKIVFSIINYNGQGIVDPFYCTADAPADPNSLEVPSGTYTDTISQYSVLTPIDATTVDNGVYVRLPGNTNPNNVVMDMMNMAAIAGRPLSVTGDYVQVRGLEMRDSYGGASISGRSDLFEGNVIRDVECVGLSAGRTSQATVSLTASNIQAGSVLNLGCSTFLPNYPVTDGMAIGFYFCDANLLITSPGDRGDLEWDGCENYTKQSIAYYLGHTADNSTTYHLYANKSDAIARNSNYITLNSTNWTGGATAYVAIDDSSQPPMVVRDNWILNSGFMGMGSGQSNENLAPGDLDSAGDLLPGRGTVLFENNHISNSNWSGVVGNWDGGGMKLGGSSKDIFRYNVWDGSSTSELWFDWEHFDNRVEGDLYLNTHGSSVSFEASPGPNLIANCIISGMLNPVSQTGFAAWDSANVWAVNNTIDSRSPSALGKTGMGLGWSPSNRGTLWLRGSGTPSDQSYKQAYVNNVVLGCANALYADSDDTVLGNYTDNPVDDPNQRAYDYTSYLLYMGLAGQADRDYRLVNGSSLADAGTGSDWWNAIGARYNLVTHDFYGLLRFSQDGDSAGATRAYHNYTTSTMEVEFADGTIGRNEDWHLPTGVVPGNVTFPGGQSVTPAGVRVVATDGQASESGDTGTFTIYRTGDVAAPLRVAYAMSGTSIKGFDYTTISNYVTILAGQSIATITIAPLDDIAVEPTETVVLTLVAGDGYVLSQTPSDNTATVLLADSGRTGTARDSVISISVADLNAGVSDNPATITVTRSGDATLAVPVTYTVAGSAVAGSDYRPLVGHVVIPAGFRTATITIQPLASTIGALDKTVQVSLVYADGLAAISATASSATVSLLGKRLGTEWKLDETSGTVAHDSSGGNLNGTVYGGAAWGSGYIGNGLTFNGTTSQYVSVPNSSTLNFGASDPFTIVTWFQLDAGVTQFAAGDWRQIFERQGSALGLWIGGSNYSGLSMDFALGKRLSPAQNFSTTFVDHKWHMVAATRDAAGTANLYVDGVLVGTAKNFNVDLSSTQPLWIGRSYWSADSNCFKGTMDNFSIYRRDLSSGEIRAAYMSTLADPTVVSVVADGGAAGESGATGRFTVQRVGPVDKDMIVYYTLGGTAVNGLDFSTLVGSVAIPAGQTSASIVVSPIDDSLIEGGETVQVTLTSPGTYTVGAPGSATLTISDNDVPTVVVLTSGPYASEVGASAGKFTVTRTGAGPALTAGDLVVSYTMSGTATNGMDYTMLSGTVIIPTGQTSATITVAPISDALAEEVETVILSLSSTTAYLTGSPTSATVIIFDDYLPTVSIVAATPNASEIGPISGLFTITRSGSAPNLTANPLTVYYTVGGTATGDIDYIALIGSVTIPAGQTSANVTVTPFDDHIPESDETVVLTLAPYGLNLDLTADGVIDSSDLDYLLRTVLHTNYGDANLDHFTDFLDFQALLDYWQYSGNWSQGDFTGDGTVDFLDFQVLLDYWNPTGWGEGELPGAGDVNGDGQVNAADIDAVYAGFTTKQPTSYYAIGAPSATVTIADSTASVSVTATVPDASETGPTNGVFTITRSRTGGDLTVNYTLSGTAVNGTDYATLSGSVTIPAGQVSATVTVAPADDSQAELTENVVLTVAPSANYTISSSTASVNLVDNDTITVPASLVGYWRFDENTGTTAYDNGGDATVNNGTLTSSQTFAAGKFGKALTFSGSGQYVSVSDNNVFDFNTGAFTVSAWVKLGSSATISTSSTYYPIISHGRSDGSNAYWEMSLRGSSTYNGVYFEVKSGTSSYVVLKPTSDQSSVFNDHAWHLVTTTKDASGNGTIYIDGVSRGTATGMNLNTTSGNSLYIGRERNSSINSYFNGTLDEVRVYSASLAAAAVTALYNQAVPSVTSVTPTNSANSGAYSVQSWALNTGQAAYGDQAWMYSTLSNSKYLGSTFIKTAQADASSTTFSLSFAFNVPCIVYVLFDDTATNKPSWLTANFTDTGDNAGNSNGNTFSIYKKVLSTGTIVLGANYAGNGTAGQMYTVMFQPLASDATP